MADSALNTATRAMMAALRPPPKIAVSKWARQTIRLSEEQSATAGRFRPLPYQEFLLDLPKGKDPAGNPVWKIVVKKAARVGLTQVQDILTLAHIENDPTSVLVVVPRHSDARHAAIRLEGICEASPKLNGLLGYTRNDTENRSSLLDRRGPGWTLKLTGATPESLRSLTVRTLFMDEIAAMEVGDEGSPVDLAIKRTATYAKAGRLVFIGSTPKSWPDCIVSREYAASWQHEWQLKCLHCDEHFTPRWRHMQWDKDAEGNHLPDTARMACPACGSLHEDGKDKADMVHGGRWHCVSETGPPGVIGCHISALGSLVPDAAWPMLVHEFLQKRGDFLEMAAFTNLVLGETVELPEEVAGDPTALSARADPDIHREAVPDDVCLITCGVDVQRDRVEASSFGWTARGEKVVLAHDVAWGDPNGADGDVWAELDGILKQPFTRTDGVPLKIKATVVDGGDGVTLDAVVKFCGPRRFNNVFVGKGVSGFSRPPLEIRRSKTAKKSSTNALIGVDAIKAIIFEGVQRDPGDPGSWRFAGDLDDEWFPQLLSEKLERRKSHGVELKRWVPIAGLRQEALDCAVYAIAARSALPRLDLQALTEELAAQAGKVEKQKPKQGWQEKLASLSNL
ncbi:MAG: hypothetical protein VR78_11020 [Hoeflea sp. BRH_c9]|nr:MAG: hypothetical protein VR78_11020 [Hoeflea sp. BRH_c9]